MTLIDLIGKLENFTKDEIETVKKAYHYAETLHDGQFRASGEEYITHPLNVAYILAEMHADCDTICAALLHDTIEDTPVKKEEIADSFNPTVANLVDGVSKLKRMNFSSKKEQNYANTKKIVLSIKEDIRIILIKLADRLHNMRTLEFKSEFKQKENALETMEIFVPLAYFIGAYRVKSELEDLSLKYIEPDKYKMFEERKIKIEEENDSILKEMLSKINQLLENRNLPNEIKIRTKNIYGLYKKMMEGKRVSDIHDLFALKIMVDEVDDCYRVLGFIHKEYHPINEKFKDYICNPKTNMYQSLHTTVFGPKDTLVQTQIRTFEMDKIASFGLTAYWENEKGNARNIMQSELKEKFQFFKSLNEINMMFRENRTFVEQVKTELFSDKVYVYTTKGDVIELPKGATAVDFAYKIHTEVGNNLSEVVVNNILVPINYILKNKDIVRIITKEASLGPNEEWLNMAQTTYARRKIKDFLKK